MRLGNWKSSTLTKLAALGLAFAFLQAAPAEAKHRRRHAPRYAPTAASYGCNSTNPFGAAADQANVAFYGGVDRHVDPRLVNDAQVVATTPGLRAYTGGKVMITSGYRDCYRNAHTPGSARNSAHLRGHAIDIRSLGSPASYASEIQHQLMNRGALTSQGGYFNTCVAHVHLDVEHKGFVNECGSRGRFRRASAPGRYKRKTH